MSNDCTLSWDSSRITVLWATSPAGCFSDCCAAVAPMGAASVAATPVAAAQMAAASAVAPAVAAASVAAPPVAAALLYHAIC